MEIHLNSLEIRRVTIKKKQNTVTSLGLPKFGRWTTPGVAVVLGL